MLKRYCRCKGGQLTKEELWLSGSRMVDSCADCDPEAFEVAINKKSSKITYHRCSLCREKKKNKDFPDTAYKVICKKCLED